MYREETPLLRTVKVPALNPPRTTACQAGRNTTMRVLHSGAQDMISFLPLAIQGEDASHSSVL